ncbi:MAG: hypothetical protein Q4D98_14175 [Planctomycetia bacterium]|nr:hypothetical protein [Planctomycetia bacterium]
MRRVLFLACVLLGAAPLFAEEQESRIVFHFEDGWQGWQVVEGSVGDGRSDIALFHHQTTEKYNKEGTWLLSTLENKGQPQDQFRGIVESPVWKNEGEEISLLIGGGAGECVFLAVCELNGDQAKEVAYVRAKNGQRMMRVTLDVKSLLGKEIFLRLFDNETGSWGHLVIDDIRAQGKLLPERTAAYRKVRSSRLPDLGGVFVPVQEKVLENAKSIPELVRQPILFVARHQYRGDHHNTATIFQNGEINTGSFNRPGAALRVADFSQLDASGQPKITTLLETKDGVIRDPDVSYDGKKILFSYRQNKDDDYHIWQMNADGTGLKQLTFGSQMSDIDPLWLPDGRIAFSSTREPKYCMCNRHIMCNLYTMNADGSHMEQIGHSTLFEGHASMLSDGRLIYDRWEYVDRNFGDAQGLWVTNPDGTQHQIFWGNNTASPGAVLEAREIPGSTEVICTFSSCHDRPWGAIAILDRNKGVDGKASIMFLLPETAMNLVDVGNYDQFKQIKRKLEDPYPLTSELFLASQQAEGERTGMLLFNRKGEQAMILEEPTLGIFDPQPLSARPVPRVIEPRVDLTQKTGVFYVSDVYESQEMKAVKRGEVKYLRVVESPEKRYWTRNFWSLGGEQAPAMNWSSFELKRVLGTVPVEEDGSANFEVPADTFVFFQLLDAQGRMVHSMRSGTMVRPGENQGCIGCHEDRLNAVPPRRTVKALMRPADKLVLPSWNQEPKAFSYMEVVQPVFDKHCVQCHDFDGPGAKSVVLAGDRNLLFNASYHSLYRNKKVVVPGAGPTKTMGAKTWGSTVSPLAKIILLGHGDQRDEKFALSAEEKERVLTWIDLNGPYYPTYASNYREHLYGRSPLTDEELLRLGELTGVVFVKPDDFWGSNGLRDCWQVALERPDKSPCLQKMDRNSEEYQEALAILRTGAERLKERPRADLETFRMMDEQDLWHEARYQRFQKLQEAQR